MIQYVQSTELYFSHYDKLDKQSLLGFKGWLIEKYKPKTVNSRILGLNKFLEFLGKRDMKLKVVKLQQKNFLERVISNADYQFFCNCLKRDNNSHWYFVVRYLAATGARVSELIQIKVEHIDMGYIDIYGKGGKVRRVYIPKSLASETKIWLRQLCKTSGYLFCNRFGSRITTRGIAHQLKNLATQYGMDTTVVYPHSFRHRFAKNFLERCSDIALLADLMGHDSIETTRIYLRRTATEQKEMVDSIVDW